MHAKIQPISSTFVATSSRATVTAAYQRRSLAGEPPPGGPRADNHANHQSLTSNIPTGPKGVYPPPAPISSHNHNLSPSISAAPPTLESRLLPRGPKASINTASSSSPLAAIAPRTSSFPAQAHSALVKRFFPGDDEEQTETPHQGGGTGFGVIPKRSKHPAGRTAISPTRTPSPGSPNRTTNGTKSPLMTRVSTAKGVYERPASTATRLRSPRSTSPLSARGARSNTDYDRGSDRGWERDRGRDRDSYETSRRPSLREEQMPEIPLASTPIIAAPIVPIAPLQLPAELYQVVNQVGEGTFGKVYKAKNVLTSTFVALKRIKVEAEKDGFPVTALREIKLLQSLSHPNVIYLHEMMVSKGACSLH